MKVSKKLIKDVVLELTGKGGVDVVKLIEKNEIPEEDIAKKMKQDIKETRNTLYQLQKHNLVSFKRKRNDENGWYTYFWTFKKERVGELARKICEAKLERLIYRLNVEKNTQFFTCKTKCMRADFENVLTFNYTCPECGEILERENNKKKVREIKSCIKNMKLDLKKFY